MVIFQITPRSHDNVDPVNGSTRNTTATITQRFGVCMRETICHRAPASGYRRAGPRSEHLRKHNFNNIPCKHAPVQQYRCKLSQIHNRYAPPPFTPDASRQLCTIHKQYLMKGALFCLTAHKCFQKFSFQFRPEAYNGKKDMLFLMRLLLILDNRYNGKLQNREIDRSRR